MTIAELMKRRAVLIQEAQAITDKAKAEERELTEEEVVTVDSKLDSADQLQAQIAEAEKAEARAGRLAAASQSLGTGAGRQTTPEPSAESLGITQVRPRFMDDPNRGFVTPREFLTAVIGAGRGRPADERLASLHVNPEQAAGSDEAGGYADPYGGFAVPEGFSPQLLQVTPERDPVAGRTLAVPMQTTIVNIPARVDKDHSSSVSGGLSVTRRSETQSGTASRIEMERVKLEATSLFGLAYATEEILTDSPISFAAIIEAGFRDEFGAKLLDERLWGTGVGQFEGVMNSGCLVSVAKEAAQTAATIVLENVLKMRSRCWGYQNAIWIANNDCYPQLGTLNTNAGKYTVPIWLPSARDSGPDTLLGRPLFLTEFCQTVGTTGDIVLGNWSQFLEGTYEPLKGASSIHVRFVNHERTFKFWMRNDGGPWWRSALTPKRGSNTLSPFVALATRA